MTSDASANLRNTADSKVAADLLWVERWLQNQLRCRKWWPVSKLGRAQQPGWSANPRTNISGRHGLHVHGTPARWTAGGVRWEFPVVAFVGQLQSPPAVRPVPLLAAPHFSPPYPSRPRSGLYLLCGSDGLVPLMPMRVGRIRAAGGVGISNRRGPAGRCRRHRPGTSPGGGHDASRQVNRLQISTSRRLQRPAPEGFSADLQEDVSGGVGSGDEEQSLPGRLDHVPGHPHRNAAEFA